ncbi:bifunctional chorismate mutase/prephenate dehydratase [Clostridium sp. JNZ X4-2]
MESLDELRNKINKIDGEMIELFQQRMNIVSKVAEYKEKKHMEILDKSREEDIIKIHLDNIGHRSMANEIEVFLRDVMSISKSLQKKKIMGLHNKDNTSKIRTYNSSCEVGFQGIFASFSYEALTNYFGDKVKTAGFDNFKDVFQALENGNIDYGVLPIENSSTGGISEVYDLLEKHKFYIVGEKCIKVNHNLIGTAGASIEDIREVYSHSQAFMQCSSFLEKHKEWRLIPYFNTARSAEYVKKENNKIKASIASKKAAEFYGLNILEENINYNSDNYTRFIIIGRNMEYDKKCDKVSILVTLPHKSGTLYNILKFFWENNLNMTKIESRPMINKPWQYFFYIDFCGNIMENGTENAIEGIERESSYFKLLGNYRGDDLS